MNKKSTPSTRVISLLVAIVAFVGPALFPASGQVPPVVTPTAPSPSLSGKWTYRSYRDTPDLVNGDASKALALIFGEGVFTFAVTPAQVLTGTLDMGGGYVLDLKGTVRNAPLTVEIVGLGRAGTPTNGWEYDYHVGLAYQWPNGVGQVPALVGSVIRAKAHNGSPAGYVASFVAVRQP